MTSRKVARVNVQPMAEKSEGSRDDLKGRPHARRLAAAALFAGRRAVAGVHCGLRSLRWRAAVERMGNGLSEARFQPAAMARLNATSVARLKLKWAFGFPGVTEAYGQPAVFGGRVFVGSADRHVYALDVRSGCVAWTFDAGSRVRTAIEIGPLGARSAAYFGDQNGSVYAVDADSGALIWKTRVDAHPAAIITGAPVLAGGKLFVAMSSQEEAMAANPNYPCCTFRGSLSALDAATGSVLWKTYTIAQTPTPHGKNAKGTMQFSPSGAAIWSAPAVDLERRVIYVDTGDSYSDPAARTSDAVLALDMNTGRLLWSRQATPNDAENVACGFPSPYNANCPRANGPDYDFGSSPILVTLAQGQGVLIAAQKSGMVYALDPDRRGALLWQRRVGQGSKLGGVQWGGAADGDSVYVAVSDVKFTPAAAGTPGAQPSMFGVSFLLDPNAGGGLFALDARTGAVRWHTPHPGCNGNPGCSPAQSAAVTAIPGVVFSGGLDGHLRAYSATNGAILWDVDTEREYRTVNSVKATGGSMDGPGPAVAGGMLYVNSGYDFLGTTPGNILLGFSIDGK
jgi:polyvinyl alcohol dehydrogenase (cytochrome)